MFSSHHLDTDNTGTPTCPIPSVWGLSCRYITLPHSESVHILPPTTSQCLITPSSPVTWAHSLPTQSSSPLPPSCQLNLFLPSSWEWIITTWLISDDTSSLTTLANLTALTCLSPSPHYILKLSPLTMFVVVSAVSATSLYTSWEWRLFTLST